MEDDDFVPRKNRDSGSLAPKRPAKRTEVKTSSSSSKSLFSEPLFSKHKTDSSDVSFGLSPAKADDKCFVCGKIVSHLNEQRRLLHVNDCLDRQETEKKKREAKKKYDDTYDCPICRKPLPPGPFRAAHAKTCGQEHTVSGKSLLEMMDVQKKAAAVRKSKNLPHTSAPPPKIKAVTAPKLKNQPKSLDDEQVQLAIAISASTSRAASPPPTITQLREDTPQFVRLEDPNERRRKRPKSFAVVEFAPRSCHCQVISAIHTRFVDAFKVACRAPQESSDAVAVKVDAQTKYQQKLVDKTNRFERLSDDLSSLLDSQTGTDFQFMCRDGTISAHKAILLARTKGLPLKEATFRISAIKEMVTLWLRYVYSGRVEWSHDEDDDVVALAEKHGPDSLVSIKKRTISEGFEVMTPDLPPTVPLSKESPEETSKEEEMAPASVKSITSTEDIFEEKTQEKENRMDDTIQGYVTMGFDGEDPMQGINISTSIVEDEDDCIVLDDSIVAKVPPRYDSSASSPLRSSEDVFVRPNRASSARSTTSSSKDIFERNPSSRSSSPDIFDNNSIAESTSGSSPRAWHMTPLKLYTVSAQSGEGSPLKPTTSSVASSSGDVFLDDYQPPPDKSEPQKRSPAMVSSSEDIFLDDENPVPPFDDFYRPNNDYYQPFDDYYQPNDEFYQPDASPAVTNNRESTASCNRGEALKATPKSSNRNRKRSQPMAVTPGRKESPVEDSFDLTPELITVTLKPSTSHDPPIAHSTPLQPVNKKLRFGSNVRIVKTVGVTPMPEYELMDDDRLKMELTMKGLRPLARKKAIAKLKEIYEATHPVVDPSTPTLRPLPRNDLLLPIQPERKAPAKKPSSLGTKKQFDPSLQPVTPEKNAPSPVKSADFSPGSDLGNRTLNDSDGEEPPEESILKGPAILPTEMRDMSDALLKWMMMPEQEELYHHVLRMEPIQLDELHVRTSRANDPVCCIPKKTMAAILELWGATFSLPQTFGRRGAGRCSKRK